MLDSQIHADLIQTTTTYFYFKLSVEVNYFSTSKNLL